MTTNAEQKILSVLDAIKAHWDLHPKQGFSTRAGGGYSYRHQAGQIDISLAKLVRDSGVGYEEITPILHKLKEDGLLEDVGMYNEAE